MKRDYGRIGVLMGGISSEREISLVSGAAVAEGLRSQGHEVVAIDIGSDIRKDLEGKNIDVAFIALHGRFGEDGTVQAMFEDMDIPYTGSGVSASRLAMDKIESRKIFEKENIFVPEYKVITRSLPEIDGVSLPHQKLWWEGKFPAVVKPAKEGSSIGLSIIDDGDFLEEAVDRAFQYDDRIIIENYIKGKEVTVGILDEQALPLIGIVPKTRFFDYRAKYQKGLTEYEVPAQIPETEYKAAQEAGICAHRALGCQSFSRVDMIIDQRGTPVVLEVNTIPGMTKTSLLPKAAKAIGIEFPQLCQKLIELAYQKHKDRGER